MAARSGAMPSGSVYTTRFCSMASMAPRATGGGGGRSQMPWPRLIPPTAAQARLMARMSEMTRFWRRAASRMTYAHRTAEPRPTDAERHYTVSVAEPPPPDLPETATPPDSELGASAAEHRGAEGQTNTLSGSE